MRIKRDYFAPLKRFLDWLFSRFKPFAVHTEAIMMDEVWEKIKESTKKNNVKRWYIMTPVNYEYFKSSFNIKESKEKLSKIMKERYLWMINHNQRLELHIHLAMTMKYISYKEQEKLFNESLGWIKKELNLEVKEFVPGWWAYNKDTLKICQNKGLKMIFPKDYDYSHDYTWVL